MNRSGKSLVVISLLILSFTRAQAQTQGQTDGQTREMDLEGALQELLSNALQVNLSFRVLPSDEKPVWSVESSRLTIPGRSVKVRLDGENVRIYLICTPYVQENGDILLVAQGQVWFTEPPENEVKYFSTFSSIPVTFGEKVLFFPLGVSSDQSAENDFFNVEIEMQIVPYKTDTGETQ
jgi:hypothetical protein